jgi:hypothetical protein
MTHMVAAFFQSPAFLLLKPLYELRIWTPKGLFQELSEQKLEPIIENGKAITIRSISSQLYESILKFVAGIGYYANRRKYLAQNNNSINNGQNRGATFYFSLPLMANNNKI